MEQLLLEAYNLMNEKNVLILKEFLETVISNNDDKKFKIKGLYFYSNIETTFIDKIIEFVGNQNFSSYSCNFDKKLQIFQDYHLDDDDLIKRVLSKYLIGVIVFGNLKLSSSMQRQLTTIELN
jgi:hypothetical protein